MKNYYVLSNGRVRREANTLYVEKADGEKKPIPVEDVESLYLYGEIDLNTKLLNFLSQKRITLHVFNYYGFYAGSYCPREYLNSGYLLVRQVAHYLDSGLRMDLARELVHASAHSLSRVVTYYDRRRPEGQGTEETPREPPGPQGVTDGDLEAAIDQAMAVEALPDDDGSDTHSVRGLFSADLSVDMTEDEELEREVPEGRFQATESLSELLEIIGNLDTLVDAQSEVNALRGIEGKMRERYYSGWGRMVSGDWAFERRVRRPPDNEVNALISFGNSMLYTVCLSEIYRTQLTPTVSYLHEPGSRRYSLALDLSEIFKPLLVDRTIFKLLNTGQLRPLHFDRSLESCYLSEAGRQLYLAAWEERLATTIRHRRLSRHVSYRHLIRLECYKLIRHLTGSETYRAFRAWW